MKQLESTLNSWFGQKAPQLPMGVKKFLVTIAPYIVIIAIVFQVMGLMTLLSFGTFGAGMAFTFGPFGAEVGRSLLIPGVLLVISLILNIMAVPGLFKRALSGWRYAYYVQLVGIVDGVYALFIGGSIVGLIISAIIGFYILFQIRALYSAGQ